MTPASTGVKVAPADRGCDLVFAPRHRSGEDVMLKMLGQSHDLEVVHRCPAEVQFSCIADGVQAATGASPGKLNLRIEPASREDLRTVIRDRSSSRSLTFTLRPEFAR
jgi:formylmethanofuran dehydrogenase subunit E